ncbi:hypothetical protein I204_01252 [Kwoniella mangroviensis CBS 8886]|uniref:uncharacterized protein n=1 Tax=Kwoniella mangroviensis CBS 8507 TaxID=1296122 RepID=UPI00080CE9C9|nr:uncharacterized protein I203_06180 [Kwoniella mangroviensis CBS 8507]OCF64934.1 hypothetical protein I203_06180 [Kwoniella mangroviensis CBS 8507]OCF77266.1 hypothetical protein I204_01252 [Kwoniella mangroviensis CBS 8886]
MEAKLQKLKVTELKELLAKHHLVQTGKKDDLVKRLLDNNVSLDDEPTEELFDPDITAPVPSIAQTSTTAPATSTTEQPTSKAAPTEPADEIPSEDTLTPEQKAMKARAERFGIPFNPKAASTKQTQKPPTSKNGDGNTKKEPANANAGPQKKESQQKAGSIDTTSLGISQDVLAKRAAKFGLPEKKDKESAPPAPAAKSTEKKVESKKEEITPEMAEKIAIEEEKKRKRAEKFGLNKPANGDGNGGGTEPDTKKVKV